MPFLFFKGKNFIRLNLATVNCFSHYVGWQQEKKLSNRKNISCMIEIYQGEITGFVKQNKITAIVNAASPTLMGSKVKSVDKSIHDFIDKSMPKGDRFKDRIKSNWIRQPIFRIPLFDVNGERLLLLLGIHYVTT